MFKRLRELFHTQSKPVKLKQNKRQRFDSIHSDSRFNFLEEIYRRLSINDLSLTDEEILDKYYKFSDSIQTNTLSAAELEWVTISIICYHRPNLIEILIRRGLLCIVYSFGDDIHSSTVLEFINRRILLDEVEPYGGLPPDVGIKWLADILPTLQDAVQKVLQDVIEQNRRELEKI